MGVVHLRGSALAQRGCVFLFVVIKFDVGFSAFCFNKIKRNVYCLRLCGIGRSQECKTYLHKLS